MTFIQTLLLVCLVSLVCSQTDATLEIPEHQFDCDSSMYIQTPQNETTVYKFHDPALAEKVLEQLDLFKPVDESNFRSHDGYGNKYHVVFYGLIKDDNYCQRHRKYFTENPEFIFDRLNFFDDHLNTSYFRTEIIGPVGNDIHPEIGYHMNEDAKKNPTIDLKSNISYFYTVASMNERLYLGKHFSCLTQSSNHIPGHWSMCRKDFVAESAINYAKQYESRPQCFTNDKFFPKTWLLFDKQNCEDFFAEFNSENYQAEKKAHRIVYIRKLSAYSHRGDGVQPVNEDEEAQIRANYDNGKLCGQVKNAVIIQKYVHSPLLIHGKKFDFRMFMLIGSMNPLTAYYHDGGLRVSLVPYDIESDDKKGLLTNFALNHEIYETARRDGLFQGRSEDELKEEQQWTFETLQKYLLEVGKINDTNWLDNYLRPEFKKAYIHLIRVARHSYLNTSSSIFEFYGADFMIDDDMNLWFIEVNSGPAMGGYTPETQILVRKMMTSLFEITLGLLRSRTKRIINFVNTIISERQYEVSEDGKVQIMNLAEKIQEFERISRNYFEKEFEPKANNTFVKIIDENLEGADAYMGYLPAECL